VAPSYHRVSANGEGCLYGFCRGSHLYCLGTAFSPGPRFVSHGTLMPKVHSLSTLLEFLEKNVTGHSHHDHDVQKIKRELSDWFPRREECVMRVVVFGSEQTFVQTSAPTLRQMMLCVFVHVRCHLLWTRCLTLWIAGSWQCTLSLLLIRSSPNPLL
jgi:hypothetical protein